MKLKFSQIKKIPLVIALLCALLAVFLLNAYLKDRERTIAEKYLPKDIVEVVIAKSNIASGKTIKPRMIDVKRMPKKFMLPNAINSPERVIGKIAQSDILEGEQILYSKVAFTKPNPEPKITATNLSNILPEGMRAITIPVDAISSMSNLIRPQDRVDIIVELEIAPKYGQEKRKMIFPLFQNVLVLATGAQVTPLTAVSGRNAYRPPSYSNVTLALEPQQSAFLAFVQEHGKIRLILRAPGDNSIEPVSPADWETLNLYLFGPPPEGEEEIPEAGRPIEIYRGAGAGIAGE